MTKVLYAKTTRHEEWGGPLRYICVVVHQSQQEFTKAAKAYAPKVPWDNAAGCFHPSKQKRRWDKKHKRWTWDDPPHWAGVIRLNIDHIHSEVVCHETVHAACHIYRMDCHDSVHLGKSCESNEEYLAYITGNLFRSVVNTLYEGGVWT